MHSLKPVAAFAWLGLGALLVPGLAAADRHPESTYGFRRDGSGRFPDAKPPLRWSEEKGVVWKTPLPGSSYSSPVLVGKRLFVASDPAELLCIDADSGKVLWQRSHSYADIFGEEKLKEIADQQEQARQLKLRGSELQKKLRALKRADDADQEQIKRLDAEVKQLRLRQKSLVTYPPAKRGGSGNSAATPVTDGERVFTLFAQGILSAHDLAGQRLWARYVETPTSGFGHSASPVLVDGKLIVHGRQLLCLNPADGKEVWRIKVTTRWGTPLALMLGDTKVVATAGGEIVRVRDGKILVSKLYKLGHNSPIVAGNVLYALDAGLLRAFRLPASEDEELAELWEVKSARQRTFASPIYHQGLLYQLTENGLLQVTDAKNGEEIYRKRLDFGRRGRVFASVTLAGKYLYLISENGTCLVLQPGREHTEVARNQLKDSSGSPIFAESRLFVRGKRNLYCIREN